MYISCYIHTHNSSALLPFALSGDQKLRQQEMASLHIVAGTFNSVYTVTFGCRCRAAEAGTEAESASA